MKELLSPRILLVLGCVAISWVSSASEGYNYDPPANGYLPPLPYTSTQSTTRRTTAPTTTRRTTPTTTRRITTPTTTRRTTPTTTRRTTPTTTRRITTPTTTRRTTPTTTRRTTPTTTRRTTPTTTRRTTTGMTTTDHHHHHHHHSDDPLDWLRESVPGEPDVDYPIHGWPILSTAFTCSDKIQGFYADPESRCQVFHVCGFGGMSGTKFLCPNGTIFNQRHFTCEWWNQASCGEAESFYSLNTAIGVVV